MKFIHLNAEERLSIFTLNYGVKCPCVEKMSMLPPACITGLFKPSTKKAKYSPLLRK